MRIYCTTNQNTYDIPAKSGNYSGICPACNETRRNKGAKSFSFDVNKGVGMCHNCEAKFVTEKPMTWEKPQYEPKVYVKPKFNKTELSQKTVSYFESRMISQDTILRMQITEQKEFMPQVGEERNCICFNYFREGELINVKYRDGAKNFKMVANAELIPYNLDKITDKAIWCEGEFDQLSFFECGFEYAISVPNGAGKTKQNLVYVDNCIDELDKVKTHIICTDNDEPGRALKEELIRRFGAENCKTIDLKDCKDANEFLVQYGKVSLQEAVNNATDVPLRGVYSVDSDYEGIIDLWKNGMPKGNKIMHEKANALITWVSSALAIWTGIPSSGKSEFVDEVCEQLNICHGWKTAYFSPENWPIKLHVSKLVSRISGRRFDEHCIGRYELDQTLKYLKDNFFFINPEDDLTVESILEHAKMLIRRHGIKQLVIDPWNKIDHRLEKGETETTYISRTLDKLTTFAQRNDILIHLVAHPTKMKKDSSGMIECPNLYDISGSAHFYNKAFYGLSVHREGEEVTLNVLKVKFRHLGNSTGGTVRFRYNMNNGRYVELEDTFVGANWDNDSHLSIPGIEPQLTSNDNFDTAPF